MDAAKTLSAFVAAAGLEGPTKIEEALVDTARLAEVLALGVSLGEIDQEAEAGIAFLLGRLRKTFIGPFLATASREAVRELWIEQGPAAMRLMDGVFLMLHEASRTHSSELLSKRIEHSGRRGIRDAAQTLADHFDPRLANELRCSLALIESAREVFRLDPAPLRDEIQLIRLFQRGVLIWSLGVHASMAIAERTPPLLGDELRADLADDVIDFIGGARMAGIGAAAMAGLLFLDTQPSERHIELSKRTPFIAFLLRATLEVRRVFGAGVRFGIAEFFYPDEPNAWELHFVIDSSAEWDVADAALDRLCDEWWDQAVAELGVDIHPVLSVIAHD